MLDGNNHFKLPETIKELVERVNHPSSKLEFRILSFIASNMLDIFNSTTSMDAARVQDLIELMDITDLFFRKRLIEVLLKAITSQLLIHNELWAGINAIKQKFGHHPEIGAVLSAQFENIFNKMFSFADNSFSPNSIIKILQECHLYLQLSIEANSRINFLTPIEDSKFYPTLKNLREHPDIDLRYHATIILQALFYLQCNRSPSENLSSSHAKMAAQFKFGNETITRNRETALTLNEVAKKNIAASFASAEFNEHFVETQLPQVNLRINKDKKLNYHRKYNEQFIYETCHFMDILMPQVQVFFSNDFLSRTPQSIKHPQSLFEQYYLLHLALSKIEESNNYLSLVTHICRSKAFDPGVRCKAMFAIFQTKHPFSIECLSLVDKYFSDKNTLKCQKELLLSKVFFALKNNAIDEASVKLFQSKSIAEAHPDTLIAVITFLSKCKTYDFNNPGLDNLVSKVRENLSKKNKEKLPDTEFQVNYYPPQDIPKDEPYYHSLLKTALVSKSVQNFIEYALKEEAEEKVVQNLEQSTGSREWFIENKPTPAQQDSYTAPKLIIPSL